MEWEPAENTMDAQLQLDAFKRQYDQLLTSHKDLVAMGRNIAKETEQLDLEMFGGPMCGHAHQLVAAMVEKLVGKMESSSAKMLAVATPKLQQLQDCLQFHLLQQRANKVQACRCPAQLAGLLVGAVDIYLVHTHTRNLLHNV